MRKETLHQLDSTEIRTEPLSVEEEKRTLQNYFLTEWRQQLKTKLDGPTSPRRKSDERISDGERQNDIKLHHFKNKRICNITSMIWCLVTCPSRSLTSSISPTICWINILYTANKSKRNPIVKYVLNNAL